MAAYPQRHTEPVMLSCLFAFLMPFGLITAPAAALDKKY